MAWGAVGKNQEVNYENFAKLDTARFKKRAQLLAFVHKRPGVLSAHVINLVRTKMGQGHVTQTKQLRRADMAAYVASGHNCLKELRNQREASTLATVRPHERGAGGPGD